MTQVTRTITFTDAELPPETPNVALVRLEILDGATVVGLEQVPFSNPVTITFANDIAPGNYTERATALSDVGVQIGNALEQPITVPALRPVPSAIAAG